MQASVTNKSRRAVTIVSLIVGLLIFALVLGLVAGAIYSFSGFFRREQSNVEETNSMEYAFRFMEKEIKKANDKVPINSQGQVTGKPERGKIILLNEVSFRYAVYDVDGRAEGIVFLFAGSDLTVSRCYTGEEAKLTKVAKGLKGVHFKKGKSPNLLEVELRGKTTKMKRTLSANVPIETSE